MAIPTFSANTQSTPTGYTSTSTLQGLPGTGPSANLRQALLLLAQRRAAAERAVSTPAYRYPSPDHMSDPSTSGHHADPFDELNSGHTYVMGGGAQDTMEGHYTQGPNTDVRYGGSSAMPSNLSSGPLPSPQETAGAGIAAGSGAGSVYAATGKVAPPGGTITSGPNAVTGAVTGTGTGATPGQTSAGQPPTGGTQIGTPAATTTSSAAPGMASAGAPSANAGAQAMAKQATTPLAGLPPAIPPAPMTAGQVNRIFDPMTQTLPTQGAMGTGAGVPGNPLLMATAGSPGVLKAYTDQRALGGVDAVGAKKKYQSPFGKR